MSKEEAKFFTEKELALHDGSDDSKPLLLCVQGMIFDVTPARTFYGPGMLTRFMLYILAHSRDLDWRPHCLRGFSLRSSHI
jgi:hypothetical protein